MLDTERTAFVTQEEPSTYTLERSKRMRQSEIKQRVNFRRCKPKSCQTCKHKEYEDGAAQCVKHGILIGDSGEEQTMRCDTWVWYLAKIKAAKTL